MRTITNARHWKLDAYGVVTILERQDGQLIRAKLEAIVKDHMTANMLVEAFANSGRPQKGVIVPLSASCSTPEKICKAAVAVWKLSKTEAEFDKTAPAEL